MPRTNRILTLTAAVLAALQLAACTNNEPAATLPTNPPASSPTTSAATPTTQPTGTPQQQALDAYLRLQHAFVKASETADPNYPDLSRYATGAALKLLTTGLASMRDKGLRGRGETIFRPKVESLAPANAPTKARVRDCMDTSKSEQYKANGEPYTDTPGGRRLVLADLERDNGAWKVIGLGVHEVGSCTS